MYMYIAPLFTPSFCAREHENWVFFHDFNTQARISFISSYSKPRKF